MRGAQRVCAQGKASVRRGRGTTNLLDEVDVLRAMKEVSQFRAALRDIVESVSEESL
jgi:hypothetical protein